tara:strand:+ start:414 stop:635 length:222 start_codon:yes stop_codon:yes gene_type:complete
MIIRKISVGADYKSSAMHYLIGQAILGGSYRIHHIRLDKDGAIKVWVERDEVVVLWKEFNGNMPISIEYNIDF